MKKILAISILFIFGCKSNPSSPQNTPFITYSGQQLVITTKIVPGYDTVIGGNHQPPVNISIDKYGMNTPYFVVRDYNSGGSIGDTIFTGGFYGVPSDSLFTNPESNSSLAYTIWYPYNNGLRPRTAHYYDTAIITDHHLRFVRIGDAMNEIRDAAR